MVKGAIEYMRPYFIAALRCIQSSPDLQHCNRLSTVRCMSALVYCIACKILEAPDLNFALGFLRMGYKPGRWITVAALVSTSLAYAARGKTTPECIFSTATP
jgi:hypothetical protein